MCGRYSAGQLSLPELAEKFQADPAEAAGHPQSWNVAPTSQVLAVSAATEAPRDTGGSDGGDGGGAAGDGDGGDAEPSRQIRRLRWGLVPRWAKDLSVGNRMINLRSETVTGKPTFRRMLAGKRCILPADGFYEWQDLGPDPAAKSRRSRKQPFYITTRDGEPLALAGLWTTWKDPEADPDTATRVASCTIITTDANQLMGTIHTRMPVLLPAQAWDTWLDPDMTDTDALAKLLVPAPDDFLTLWPVDTAVNHARSNGPELTRPLEGHEARVWS